MARRRLARPETANQEFENIVKQLTALSICDGSRKPGCCSPPDGFTPLTLGFESGSGDISFDPNGPDFEDTINGLDFETVGSGSWRYVTGDIRSSQVPVSTESLSKVTSQTGVKVSTKESIGGNHEVRIRNKIDLNMDEVGEEEPPLSFWRRARKIISRLFH